MQCTEGELHEIHASKKLSIIARGTGGFHGVTRRLWLCFRVNVVVESGASKRLVSLPDWAWATAQGQQLLGQPTPLCATGGISFFLHRAGSAYHLHITNSFRFPSRLVRAACPYSATVVGRASVSIHNTCSEGSILAGTPTTQRFAESTPLREAYVHPNLNKQALLW